jgi:hypothetical protein
MNLQFLLVTLWAVRVMKQQNTGHVAMLENGNIIIAMK